MRVKTIKTLYVKATYELISYNNGYDIFIFSATIQNPEF